MKRIKQILMLKNAINKMKNAIDSFNNKLDDNTKHINNLVITMAIGVGVAVISAVIAIASLIRS